MAFYGSTGNGPLYDGKVASTMDSYRATIVPDGTGNVYGKDGRSSVWEAVRWIKDYAEVNGVQDLKDAVGVIEEKLESIL